MSFLRFGIMCLTVISMFIPQGMTGAASLLSDPVIPDGEKITYACRRGDESSMVVEEVRVKKEGEKFLYEVTSASKFQEMKIRLQKPTMEVASIHAVRKFPAVTLDSTLTVVDERTQSEGGEMKLADFSVLTYMLRGFPFTQLEKLKIGYFGEQRNNFYAMCVKFKGREKRTVKSGTFDCYKLEFGMDGFFGTFVPKIDIWYSVKTPHYLVYYEGPDGPPGTPKRIMEMVQYTMTSP